MLNKLSCVLIQNSLQQPEEKSPITQQQYLEKKATRQ